MDLRIATFNLETLDLAPGGEDALDRRIAVLGPLLDRLQADVLCLQEVNAQRVALAESGAGRSAATSRLPGGGGPTPPRPPREPAALKRLLAATRYADCNLITSSGPSGDGPADVHNLAIVSRFPVARSEELRHALVPPQPYHAVTARPAESAELTLEWDRPLLHAVLEPPAEDGPGGGHLHVVNLHLRSPLAAPIPGQKIAPFAWATLAGWAEGYFAATVKRSGQALEARLLVERIFDAEPQARIAVCGDLNAGVEETPARILRGVVEDSGNPALAGRVLVPLEQSLPAAARFSVIHGGRKLMLDHILTSPALTERFAGLEVLNDALPDELTMAEDDPRSNHAPLIAGFE